MAGFLKEFVKKRVSENQILLWHKLKSLFAAFYFRYPANRLKVIGVTGTNGKTTTCHLINSILEKAGKKTSMITTTTLRVNGKSIVNDMKMTTPDGFLLQKIIKEIADSGSEYLVLETSSHALAQHRTTGISYDVAVMTNLTREHLDYHKTFEEYQAAKMMLFKDIKKSFRKPSTPKSIVLNHDDRSFKEFSQASADRVFSYGILRGDVVATSPVYHEEGTEFMVNTPIGKSRIRINLPGRFNVYNALAAISASVALGIELKSIQSALAKKTGIPGRMEVINENQNFKVIVDYAHTPDGLNQILETLKPTLKGRLIIVVGAEGRRSKTKRPLLGALSSRYGDKIIVTNVDPRDEDPMEIINQVADGVKRGSPDGAKKLIKIEKRRKAIKKAFDLARPQDTVLLLAKGAEQTLELKNKTIKWDDRKVARELLKKNQYEKE